MINAHFNAHKNQDNAQLKAHYPILKVCNILTVFLLSIFITPKHLNLLAGGMPSGNSAFNPLEGYRTPSTSKTTPAFGRHTNSSKPLTRQGGTIKVYL